MFYGAFSLLCVDDLPERIARVPVTFLCYFIFKSSGLYKVMRLLKLASVFE